MSIAPPAPQEISPETTPRTEPSQHDIRRGYRFWFVIFAAILLVEAAGAADNWLRDHIGVDIPWTTISGMVGHLEDLWPTTAVVVVAILAPAAFYALAPVDPLTQIGAARRSALGRWYKKGSPPEERVQWYTPELVFAASALVAFIAVLVFDDDFMRAYFIYGALFTFGILVPSLFVLARREVGFPSLFVTISHLRLNRDWKAVLATIALSAGLAILVIHLAFYPWPDITKERVKYAGLTANEARSRATKEVRRLQNGSSALIYSTQARAVVGGREAWVVYFSNPDRSDSGCVVTIGNADKVAATPECSE